MVAYLASCWRGRAVQTRGSVTPVMRLCTAALCAARSSKCRVVNESRLADYCSCPSVTLVRDCGTVREPAINFLNSPMLPQLEICPIHRRSIVAPRFCRRARASTIASLEYGCTSGPSSRPLRHLGRWRYERHAPGIASSMEGGTRRARILGTCPMLNVRCTGIDGGKIHYIRTVVEGAGPVKGPSQRGASSRSSPPPRSRRVDSVTRSPACSTSCF